jgi:hypothetical protein
MSVKSSRPPSGWYSCNRASVRYVVVVNSLGSVWISISDGLKSPIIYKYQNDDSEPDWSKFKLEEL